MVSPGGPNTLPLKSGDSERAATAGDATPAPPSSPSASPPPPLQQQQCQHEVGAGAELALRRDAANGAVQMQRHEQLANRATEASEMLGADLVPSVQKSDYDKVKLPEPPLALSGSTETSESLNGALSLSFKVPGSDDPVVLKSQRAIYDAFVREWPKLVTGRNPSSETQLSYQAVRSLYLCSLGDGRLKSAHFEDLSEADAKCLDSEFSKVIGYVCLCALKCLFRQDDCLNMDLPLTILQFYSLLCRYSPPQLMEENVRSALAYLLSVRIRESKDPIEIDVCKRLQLKADAATAAAAAAGECGNLEPAMSNMAIEETFPVGVWNVAAGQDGTKAEPNRNEPANPSGVVSQHCSGMIADDTLAAESHNEIPPAPPAPLPCTSDVPLDQGDVPERPSRRCAVPPADQLDWRFDEDEEHARAAAADKTDIRVHPDAVNVLGANVAATQRWNVLPRHSAELTHAVFAMIDAGTHIVPDSKQRPQLDGAIVKFLETLYKVLEKLMSNVNMYRTNDNLQMRLVKTLARSQRVCVTLLRQCYAKLDGSPPDVLYRILTVLHNLTLKVDLDVEVNVRPDDAIVYAENMDGQTAFMAKPYQLYLLNAFGDLGGFELLLSRAVALDDQSAAAENCSADDKPMPMDALCESVLLCAVVAAAYWRWTEDVVEKYVNHVTAVLCRVKYDWLRFDNYKGEPREHPLLCARATIKTMVSVQEMSQFRPKLTQLERLFFSCVLRMLQTGPFDLRVRTLRTLKELVTDADEPGLVGKGASWELRGDALLDLLDQLDVVGVLLRGNLHAAVYVDGCGEVLHALQARRPLSVPHLDALWAARTGKHVAQLDHLLWCVGDAWSASLRDRAPLLELLCDLAATAGEGHQRELLDKTLDMSFRFARDACAQFDGGGGEQVASSSYSICSAAGIGPPSTVGTGSASTLSRSQSAAGASAQAALCHLCLEAHRRMIDAAPPRLRAALRDAWTEHCVRLIAQMQVAALGADSAFLCGLFKYSVDLLNMYEATVPSEYYNNDAASSSAAPGASNAPLPDAPDRPLVLQRLNDEYSLCLVLCNSLQDYMMQARTAASQLGVDSLNGRLWLSDNVRTHEEHVRARLDLLDYVLTEGRLQLHVAAALQLWNDLVLQPVFAPVDRDIGFDTFTKFVLQGDLEESDVVSFFTKHMTNLNPTMLTLAGVRCFAAMFRLVNSKAGKLRSSCAADADTPGDDVSQFYLHDLALIGMDYLWSIIANGCEPVARRSIDLLCSVLTAVQASTAQAAQQAASLPDVNEYVLHECLDRLRRQCDTVDLLLKDPPAANPHELLAPCTRIERLLLTVLTYVKGIASNGSDPNGSPIAAAPHQAVPLYRAAHGESFVLPHIEEAADQSGNNGATGQFLSAYATAVDISRADQQKALDWELCVHSNMRVCELRRALHQRLCELSGAGEGAPANGKWVELLERNAPLVAECDEMTLDEVNIDQYSEIKARVPGGTLKQLCADSSPDDDDSSSDGMAAGGPGGADGTPAQHGGDAGQTQPAFAFSQKHEFVQFLIHLSDMASTRHGDKDVSECLSKVWPLAQQVLMRMPPDSTELQQLMNSNRTVNIQAPPGCKRLQHEVELGVIVGRKCSRAPAAEANKCIAGYVLALDMTARDLQGELKEAKLPWYLAKSFDTSCPVSDFIPSHLVPDPQKVQLSCSVNGQIRQQGSTSQMIFPVSVLIEYISKYVTLLPGDLILTGTPAGVSDVSNGDVIKCEMQVEGAAEPLARLEVDVKIFE